MELKDAVAIRTLQERVKVKTLERTLIAETEPEVEVIGAGGILKIIRP